MTDTLATGRTILSLCDYTGNWPSPYREAGYNVIQVDLKHGQDVRLLKLSDLPTIHGILAAPPCTAFATSGAQYWKAKDADGRTLEGLSIVDACLRIITALSPVWWCLENPIGRLREFIGPYRMTFHPCDYGDPYTKKTCLWGNFNPDLPRNPVSPKFRMGGASKKRNSNGCYRLPEATKHEEGRQMLTAGNSSWVMQLGGSSERTKELRSATPMGFARAFFEANP